MSRKRPFSWDTINVIRVKKKWCVEALTSLLPLYWLRRCVIFLTSTRRIQYPSRCLVSHPVVLHRPQRFLNVPLTSCWHHVNYGTVNRIGKVECGLKKHRHVSHGTVDNLVLCKANFEAPIESLVSCTFERPKFCISSLLRIECPITRLHIQLTTLQIRPGLSYIKILLNDAA